MRYLLLLTVFLCTGFCFAQKKNASPFIRPLPVPHQAVNDYGNLLTSSERRFLENELVNYNQTSGNAIVFISLGSLTDPKTKKQYTIEEAAQLYFNKWGIGDSIKNNGVLLIVSRNPRTIRIQTGTGVEAMLPNSNCQRIINTKLAPNFKQGLFFTGIKEAVEAIEKSLDDPRAAQQLSSASGDSVPALNYHLHEVTDAEAGSAFAMIGGVLGAFILIFVGVTKWYTGKWFVNLGRRGCHYHRGGHHRHSINNNYTNNNFYSNGGSSHGDSSRSSSSSSSSAGSYGGGSSSGGGASGSW